MRLPRSKGSATLAKWRAQAFCRPAWSDGVWFVREAVLPQAVTARVSVEAGLALSWWRLLGSHGRAVSLEHFGASAPYQKLFEEFGITTDAVVAAAHDSIAASKS